MKTSRHLIRAEKALCKMEAELAILNSILTEHTGEDIAIMHQPSDGWVALFDGDCNAPLSPKEIDQILSMDADTAMAYLRSKSC